MDRQRPRSRTSSLPEAWAGYLGGIFAEVVFVAALMLAGLLVAAVMEALL